MVLVIGVPRFASGFSWNLGKLICRLLICQDYWEEGTEGRESGSKSKRPNSTKEFNNNSLVVAGEESDLAFDRSKAKQKEEQWWEEPGDSVFVLFNLLDLGW